MEASFILAEWCFNQIYSLSLTSLSSSIYNLAYFKFSSNSAMVSSNLLITFFNISLSSSSLGWHMSFAMFR